MNFGEWMAMCDCTPRSGVEGEKERGVADLREQKDEAPSLQEEDENETCQLLLKGGPGHPCIFRYIYIYIDIKKQRAQYILLYIL